MSFHVTEFQL